MRPRSSGDLTVPLFHFAHQNKRVNRRPPLAFVRQHILQRTGRCGELDQTSLFEVAGESCGQAHTEDTYTIEDVAVLENWRAWHSYILNTFQAILRFRSKGKNVTVAQRLKRRHTIFDKLRREPNMQLSTMHDIAGCRLIFEDETRLVEFRKSLHKSKAKHKLRSADNDRYNYILYPKEGGYRSIHDVYEYCVSSENGVTWNGLLIEIQYRTIFQHAWATAVEVADLITYKRIKFSEADQDHHYFFQLASEIIARAWESRSSSLSELPNGEIIREFRRLDNKLGLMETFRKPETVQPSVWFESKYPPDIPSGTERARRVAPD